MKLYLVRHGEAVTPEIDPNQPLSLEGSKKLESFSRILKKGNIQIDEVFHSGKLRAKQTAEILMRNLNPRISLQEKAGLKPNDSVESILEEIESKKNTLMLVSHLPFLQNLLAKLLKVENPYLFRFQAGSIVCLEKESYGWVLSWSVAPGLFISEED